VCGFIVPGYFAGILDAAKASGNLAGGYAQVCWTLAAISVACAAVCAILQPPHKN
jgi:hypothetical protein